MVEPKYGLRKLSVGLCSVLLGTTVMLVNTVHADSDTKSDAESVDAVADTQRPYQEDQAQVNADNDQSQQMSVDNSQRVNADTNTLTVDHGQSFSSSQMLTESKQSSDELTSADFDNSDGPVVKTTAGWTSHASDYDSIAKSDAKLTYTEGARWLNISPQEEIHRGVSVHSILDGSKLKVGNKYLLFSITVASKNIASFSNLEINDGRFDSQTMPMRSFILNADDKPVAKVHLCSKTFKKEIDYYLQIDQILTDSPVRSIDFSYKSPCSLIRINPYDTLGTSKDFSNYKPWINKSIDLVVSSDVVQLVFVKKTDYINTGNWASFRDDVQYDCYGVNATFVPGSKINDHFSYIFNVKNSVGFIGGARLSGSYLSIPLLLPNGKWVDEFDYVWSVIPNFQVFEDLGADRSAEYLQSHLPKEGGWVYSKQSDGSFNVGFTFSQKAIVNKILADPSLKMKIMHSYAAVFETDDPEKFAEDNIVRLKTNPTSLSTLQVFCNITAKDRTKPYVVTMTDITPGTANKLAVGINTHGIPTISSSGILYHHTLLKMLDDTNTQVGGVDYLQAVPGEQDTYTITVPAGYHLADQQVNGSYYTIDGTSVKYTLGDQAKMNAEPIIIHLVRNDYTNSYHFVDDDNDGATVGSVVNFSGKMGQLVKLSIVAPKNYQVVGELPTEYVFNNDNQPLVIHLKHQHEDVTMTDTQGRQENEYRVIEDLPDGSRPVILDCIIVNHRDADKDLVTGKITYGKFESKNSEQKVKIRDGEWESGSYVSDLPVDKVAGYDAAPEYSQLGVASNGRYIVEFKRNGKNNTFDFLDDPDRGNLTYDNIPANHDWHVKYNTAIEPITLNYYDVTGTQISTHSASGKYLSKYTADDSTVPKGYVIASGQNRTITVSWDTNELDLLVIQQLKFVGYTSGDTDLNRYITRYITVELPDGNLQQIKQQVRFVRDRWDNVLDSSVYEYTPWRALTTNELPAYVPIKKDGYTIGVVPAKMVTPETVGLDPVFLTYQPISKPQSPKYIDVNGNTYNDLPSHYVVADGQDLNVSGQLIVKSTAISTSSKPKMLTRIINVTIPGGHSRTIRQQVMSGTNFSQVRLPHLRGYHVVITSDTGNHKTNLVNGFTLASVFADRDVTVNISFVK